MPKAKEEAKSRLVTMKNDEIRYLRNEILHFGVKWRRAKVSRCEKTLSAESSRNSAGRNLLFAYIGHLSFLCSQGIRTDTLQVCSFFYGVNGDPF